MEIELKKQPNGKYTLIGEFEIGESGEYTRRVLVSGVSKKKAKELKLKYSRKGGLRKMERPTRIFQKYERLRRKYGALEKKVPKNVQHV